MAKLTDSQISTLPAEDILDFTAGATRMVFRKPGMADMSGPYQELLAKDAATANQFLLKILCLTHEPAELEALWNKKYAFYLVPLRAVMDSLDEGVALTKKG